MINGRAIMKNNWKKSLSIIVPVFNEEEAVEKTVSELKATFFESSREQQAKIYTEIKSLESKLSDLMNNWEELEGKEE